MQRMLDSLTIQELLAEPWIQQNTAIGDTVRWAVETVRENREQPLYKDRYQPIVSGQPAEHAHPFLSIIMRTQLKRPDALTEVLLSLSAQSSQDFEVVLIPHRVSPATLQAVRDLVRGFGDGFASKVRILPLDEGNRTAPLNFGFAHSWGDYVSVLDDDDLVMEHWVSEFQKAAAEEPGTVLHCYAVAQDWSLVASQGGPDALCAVSKPRAEYCKPFSSLVELRINRCPVFSLAFPGYAFKELGFLFDESLSTTEDWDFLRRVTAFCGVTDIPRVGGIYRLWRDRNTSHKVHGQAEWKRNYQRITAKEQSYPVILRRSQLQEGLALSRMIEGVRDDEDESGGLTQEERTIRDLKSIVAAQRETIAALEKKSWTGRTVGMLRLIYHRALGRQEEGD